MSEVIAVQHDTLADTQPNPDDQPGGMWMTTCTCGWERTGRYARTNTMAEYVALRLANAYGRVHELDPAKTEQESDA